MILSMPYARFVQSTRLAAAAAADEIQNEFRLAAFVGWQNASVQGAIKRMSFDKYLKGLGLNAKQAVPRGQIAAEREAAHERANSVREAFRRTVSE